MEQETSIRCPSDIVFNSVGDVLRIYAQTRKFFLALQFLQELITKVHGFENRS